MYLQEAGSPPLVYTALPAGGIGDPAVQLLLFTEIARRKAIDPYRGGGPAGMSDEYHDLPVGLGIAMARRLIGDNHITFDSFWCSNAATGNCHMFR